MVAMAKVLKWVALAAALVLLLLSAVALGLQQWLRTDDFRNRVEAQASEALGVPLKLGRLSVDLWPLPAIAADQVRLQTKQPLTLARVEARPLWTALLAGRLEIATLIVRDAVLPQTAIAAIGAAMQKRAKGAPPPPADDRGSAIAWPQQAVLDRVTWIDSKGQRLTLDAQAHLAADGLLEKASFHVRQGRFAGTRGEVQREADHWPVRVAIGGGRIEGKLQLRPGRAGHQVLQGQLETSHVEVSALTAPSRVLTGKLQAQTQLRAEFRELGQLPDVLTSQTRFSVRDAVVHGLDLVKAVQTIGLSRGGETPLDTLAGQVDTQGSAVRLSHLVATSGKLTAQGDVALARNRSLSGRVTVDLASSRGTVGIPLVVGGTADAPTVTLTRGAMVGAVIGTAVAPGVGTGAGAKLGDRIGEGLRGLFK